MKRVLSTVFLFFVLCRASYAGISLYFSPYDNCETQWVEMINSAHKTIKISAFGLTNENIYKALENKAMEGVKIIVCEDKMQSGSKHDKRDLMRKNGIEVIVKKVQVLEHNKMIVVDDKSGIIGSWNLSENAQKQDNSMVVFIDEPIYAKQISQSIDRIYTRDKI